jgi:hypothetical protein
MSNYMPITSSLPLPAQPVDATQAAPKRPPNKAPYVVGRDGQSRQANMTTRNAVDYRPISMMSQIIKSNATENSGE